MLARARNGEFVERMIDHPVVDETGITGVYDIDLQWVPADGRPAPLNEPGVADGYPPRHTGVKADSIFGALEAAGLKLRCGSRAVDVLVIDRVERLASEN
jgi:uncharacterized protein (TIGR03435 family)